MSLGIGDAVSIAVALVQYVGDGRTLAIEIRKWAYQQSGGDRNLALPLEAWVHAVDDHLVKGHRRMLLRMWAYDQVLREEILSGTLTHENRLARAALLYEWTVESETAYELPGPALDAGRAH